MPFNQYMGGTQGMQQGNPMMMGRQNMQQSQNQIKNPQTGMLPEIKGPQINDRDSVNLALAQEKYLTDNLNVFVREASHRQLHNDLMRIFTETHVMTRELFNLMFRKGWYTLEAEQARKLAQTHQNFTGYSSQFPYANYLQ
ncbi:Coat F domain-containing protein [Desulfotomaculum arcticum]|uniref:Coat F domain-containing protein n=1 Tax=Desulfotruncus arcticus DSM 17038 TaxID=1121424 RepID=A0A1I2U1X7_9FIRM|nr:spore coat protein [Desulfotruncus arcticus]SFG70983.1 Coat F domain-containing protein [Desulfotomaculum arcticum] [Desulfotruncus arcticus DSM 17038]